jgi:membrane protease YdiL (CAAX protease family)
VLPAFLVELGFYLVIGFASVRKAFDKLGSKPFRAALLSASAVIPYLIESTLTGTFQINSFLLLLAMAAATSFWYVWIPRSMPADLLFLALLGAVYLSKGFDQIYGKPVEHVGLGILGKLMWIRIAIMAILSLRSPEHSNDDAARFGFIPTLREWGVGALHYLYFLPVGVLLGYGLRFASFHLPVLEWWKIVLLAVGTFLGFLWVVALSEEFFFRGFLQRLLARGLHSEILGLIVASIIFGLVHLPFRQFPNWRFAILAGVAGIFYGLAFLKAKSVRASMVTHALLVTTWRVFFAS